MPDKSRRRKGTPSVQSKKKKSRLIRSTTLAPQPAVAQTGEPAAKPSVSVPSVKVPAPVAKPTAVRYPYIAAELRTIAILAGLMLILLVVLAWRFS